MSKIRKVYGCLYTVTLLEYKRKSGNYLKSKVGEQMLCIRYGKNVFLIQKTSYVGSNDSALLGSSYTEKKKLVVTVCVRGELWRAYQSSFSSIVIIIVSCDQNIQNPLELTSFFFVVSVAPYSFAAAALPFHHSALQRHRGY